MEIPIHHLWYNVADSIKVDQFRRYEDDNPYFTACFFVGGAGVGKSACVTKFATVKRVHFVTPTNYAGNALDTSLRKKTVCVRAHPTVFSLLHENLSDASFNNAVYRNKLDSAAKNATVSSLSDLWKKLEPAFHEITTRRHKNVSEKNKYLTPEEFARVKDEAVAQGWLTAETELSEVLNFVRSTQIVPYSSVPLELTYDTLIIDEAGRMTALELLRLAYDYGIIRAEYGYPHKLKFIIEGSCTQQTVINKSGYPLNDYSALTMIAAPFFENVPFFARLSTHNRRCSGGDLGKTAVWFNFVDKMEKGQFIPPSLKKKFFDAFGVTNFYPTKEEIAKNPSVMQRVYLATEHEVISRVTEHMQSHMRKVNVTEWFASVEEDACKRVPFITDPHENLGSGYRSVPYVNDEWTRTEPASEDDDEYRYVNERTLFVDGVYTMTHRARVTVTGVDAKPDQFLKDYALLRPYMTDECVAALTMNMIDYLTTTMRSLIATHCPRSVVSQLRNVQSIWERIRTDAEVERADEEEEDGGSTTTNYRAAAVVKMEAEILGIMRVVASVVPVSVDFRRSVDMDVWANVILYKGYDLIVTRVQKNMLRVRLGRSFTAAMFRKPITLRDTSVLNFNTSSRREYGGAKRGWNGGARHQRPVKRKKTESDDENTAAIMEIVRDRLEGREDEGIVTGRTKGASVTARIYPIRSNLTLTIAASQSRTFTFDHVAYWGPTKKGKVISAEDVNVSATRLSDTSQFHVYVPNPDTWTYSPFSKHTKKATEILRKIQSKVGHLL